MGEFKVISYKKKKNHKSKFETRTVTASLDAVISKDTSSLLTRETIIQRIHSAKDEIKNSEFFKKFYQDLIQEGSDLQNIDIVTYGLGQFSQCVTSRYQLAFILVLTDICKANLHVYDPVLSVEELEVISFLKGCLITTNEEGKRKVSKKTIFFLPHCPKQLLNNLLWKNWTKGLKYCVIVGNSIKNIVDSHPDRFLKQNLTYIFHAASFVTEIKINNCFKFSDIFNDLSIHLFSEQTILNLEQSVSDLSKEPQYKEEDIEFISASLESHLTLLS